MKTEITDFKFKPTGYGHYTIIYTCPKTNDTYKITTNNMTIIDKTKNADKPKKNDLITLKQICKCATKNK